MEKYKEYKDSGVQWLGEIPSHWKAVLNGRIFKEDVRKALDTDISLSLSQKNGLIPTEEMQESSLKTSSYANWKHVTPCDLVINRFKAHLGVMFASNYTGMVSFHYGVFKSVMPTNSKYYEYLFHTNVYKFLYADVSNGMTVGLQNLSNTAFYKVRGLYPPLAEQHSIVSYLDTKCSQLDTLLSNKEKEISLLQEMKQRVIADAVTRGINPSVKFKTTNIPWLPEIPEHWGKVKLKVLTLEGKNKNSENLETNVLSLSYGKIIRKKNINEGLVPSDYATYQIVDVDDIILRLTDLQNDHRSLRCGLVKERGIITSAYVCLKIRQGVSEYFYFLLHSFDIKKVFYSMGGGLRQSMNYTEVSKLRVPVPPLSEQRSIVSYITERASKIDLLIEKLNKEIECIKEYKQCLISDVVTGQVKVC